MTQRQKENLAAIQMELFGCSKFGGRNLSGFTLAKIGVEFDTLGDIYKRSGFCAELKERRDALKKRIEGFVTDNIITREDVRAYMCAHGYTWNFK